jgi:hypothetical protein
MKKALLAIVLSATPFATSQAEADDKAACFDAAENGQTLRAAHKLIEARDQFRLCAAATCPAATQTDCGAWVTEVDKSIPTVVLSAKDATGNDVLEVNVSVDDAALTTKLDGTSIPVNPGAHDFRFQWADGTTRDRQVLVAEGEKDKLVLVSLVPQGGVPAASPPAPTSTAPVAPVAAPAPKPVASPWRGIGWVAGGVGVGGLALGAVFTGITIADKGAAGCSDTTKTCTNYGALTSAQSVAPVAGAGLIVGGALVVAGAALVLFTPRPKEGGATLPAASIRLAPLVGAHVDGALFEGAW